MNGFEWAWSRGGAASITGVKNLLSHFRNRTYSPSSLRCSCGLYRPSGSGLRLKFEWWRVLRSKTKTRRRRRRPVSKKST